MQINRRSCLGSAVGLAIAASAALAEPAATLPGVTIQGAPASTQPAAVAKGASLQVAPNTVVTVPTNPAAGFDAPAPALKLQGAGADAVAGLAPGQDLVGDAGPGAPPLSAAETDTYFNTKEFQDKNDTVQHRPGHAGAGPQFAGTGEAMAGQAVIQGIGALIGGN
jgi:hypothetical protein